LRDYAKIVGEEVVEHAFDLGRKLKGARLLHINATAFGGGVAELLYTLVPLMRDVGLDAEWKTIEGGDDFFTITKLIHNGLQGMDLLLTPQMKEIYLSQNEVNASRLSSEYDFVIVHDPQPLALRSFLDRKPKGRWIWRCHIDTTCANRQLWDFLIPYIKGYDATIFTRREYVGAGLESVPISVIAPSIDPLSPKNQTIEHDVIHTVVGKYNVDRRRPFLLQVSRFDPWKDPLGVIDVYRMAKEKVPELQLVMLASMASDDPEGWHYYEKTARHAEGDPDVHMLTNMEGIGNLEVNAFQRAAGVVMQKSIREGFGLVVTEALWKQKAVVASPVGGIVLQIVNNETGFLVSSTEESAEKIVYLLQNPEVAARVGEAGLEYIRHKFLSPRNLTDYLQLLVDLS